MIRLLCITEYFKVIFRDQNLLLEFRRFVKSELSQENLDFWLAVENFRKNNSSGKTSKCKSLLEAKKIYRKFVAPGASSEINVEISHSRNISQRLSLADIDHGIFDAAQREIYLLIKRDSFPRFKSKLESDLKSAKS